MKRKRYLHTKFVKFLIESERQAQKEIQDEIEEDEVQELDADEVQDEIEEDEVQELDADEVIERLVQSHKKLKKEYDDIVYGRKRK